jgi:integrase
VLTSKIWLLTTRVTLVLGCHLAGGELEQIQFLLGHASVQTTERYLGCKQKLGQAVNDNLGLEDT